MFSCSLASSQHLLVSEDRHRQEDPEHCEDHPDVNHLDIGGGWQELGDSDEAEKSFLDIQLTLEAYSQGSQDQEDGEVDLDDHVKIPFFRNLGEVT